MSYLANGKYELPSYLILLEGMWKFFQTRVWRVPGAGKKLEFDAKLKKCKKGMWKLTRVSVFKKLTITF